jgi:polyisoprenoid-binding protein YceI
MLLCSFYYPINYLKINYKMSHITKPHVSTIKTWTSDPVHSSASFAIDHMVVSKFQGWFNNITGTLNDHALIGSVDVSSIQVKDEALYSHLQSHEFFDAENYPRITFHSTLIRDHDNKVSIEGDLSIKGYIHDVVAEGVWHEVSFDTLGHPRIGLDLSSIIDRTTFGLDWNASMPEGKFALGNNVELNAHLEFMPVFEEK